MKRNVSLDLLRLFFATLVLLSHAPELTDGSRQRELFTRLTHTISFGEFGVDGFFLLSGFLIVQSWIHYPVLSTYLSKRVLRIVPGYLVAVFLSTVILGSLMPGVPAYFHHFGPRFIGSVLLLSAPITPNISPLPHASAMVNGSLWTITYEFRCYLLVAFLGVIGLARRPAVWAGLAAFCLLATNWPWLHGHLAWQHQRLLLGDPPSVFRLTAAFLIGACFFFFRDWIAFRPLYAACALTSLVLACVFLPRQFESVLLLAGGYLLFYLTRLRLPLLTRMHGLPDISYGVYLYGWPAETLWIYYVHGSPWVTFAACTAICLALGWLSWHLVERPALRFKRQATAPLPPP